MQICFIRMHCFTGVPNELVSEHIRYAAVHLVCLVFRLPLYIDFWTLVFVVMSHQGPFLVWPVQQRWTESYAVLRCVLGYILAFHLHKFPHSKANDLCKEPLTLLQRGRGNNRSRSEIGHWGQSCWDHSPLQSPEKKRMSKNKCFWHFKNVSGSTYD